MADSVAVARRIRDRIEQLGLNASNVSLRAGLGRSAVRDIITGKSKSPSLNTLVSLTGPLECSLLFLTEGKSENDVEAARFETTELAKVRSSAGFTQRQLAARAGLHWVTVSKLERGRMEMTTEYILMFAAALGVPPIAVFVAAAAQTGCVNVFISQDGGQNDG